MFGWMKWKNNILCVFFRQFSVQLPHCRISILDSSISCQFIPIKRTTTKLNRLSCELFVELFSLMHQCNTWSDRICDLKGIFNELFYFATRQEIYFNLKVTLKILCHSTLSLSLHNKWTEFYIKWRKFLTTQQKTNWNSRKSVVRKFSSCFLPLLTQKFLIIFH